MKWSISLVNRIVVLLTILIFFTNKVYASNNGLHGFLTSGGVFVKTEGQPQYLNNQNERFLNEIKHKIFTGLAYQYNDFSISFATNQLYNKTIHEQMSIYSYKMDIATKIIQNNITLSYAVYDRLLLNVGYSRVNYKVRIEKLQYFKQTNFDVYNIGLNFKLLDFLYLGVNYSPHYLNNYASKSGKKANYIGGYLTLFYF